MRLGQKEEGTVSFRKAISIRPRYVEAQQNLGNLYRDRGSLEEAVQCYRQVLQMRAEHREARQQLAVVLHQQGQLESAIACLHQDLLFHHDSPDTYNLLGILLAGEFDPQDAAWTCDILVLLVTAAAREDDVRRPGDKDEDARRHQVARPAV